MVPDMVSRKYKSSKISSCVFVLKSMCLTYSTMLSFWDIWTSLKGISLSFERILGSLAWFVAVLYTNPTCELGAAGIIAPVAGFGVTSYTILDESLGFDWGNLSWGFEDSGWICWVGGCVGRGLGFGLIVWSGELYLFFYLGFASYGNRLICWRIVFIGHEIGHLIILSEACSFSLLNILAHLRLPRRSVLAFLSLVSYCIHLSY